MNREIEFGKTLEAVKHKARAQQNFITKKEVEEAFLALSLSDEQMEMVYDYLRQNKIGVDEPADVDSFLLEEERNYLDSYLEALAAIPAVTQGEKEAIILSAMAGDADAAKRLIELMLPEVPQIAKLYTGQGVSLEDLIGEGNVALSLGVTMLGAMEHANEAQGMLAGMMMDAMEESIAAREADEKSDQKIADKVNKVADAANALQEELRRKVTVEELMEESGLSRKAIEDAVRVSGGKIESIESPAAGEED